MRREKAIAVGNRAGIVEWANAAWSRVTGYALEDAIAKPVGDLLSQAGIDAHVIDFVQRHFERGEPCEIELPLQPPNGPFRFIHVSIESLRDRHGEVSHFAAIAWDVSDERREAAETEAAAPPARDEAAPRPRMPLRLATTDLSAFVREQVGRHADGLPARTELDLALPDGLPAVRLDRDRVGVALGGLVADAVTAVGDEWGTVSVSTGVARSEARFVSPTYPRDTLLRGLPEGLYVWVEIHDTGLPVDRTVVAAVASARAELESEGRVARLAAARRLLRAHGGDLRIDADPGFGTRVILLFPAS